jgi:glyoxylase-like metal-dependent hydrolase (beta-lactamase superfamily II)
VQVADGIHRLTRGVVNFYLVEDGAKLTLVDAGAPGDWETFERAAGSLGRTLVDLDAVLLTHAHSDHTGFAERARTQAEAEIWIHGADAEGPEPARPPRTKRASPDTSSGSMRTAPCSD